MPFNLREACAVLDGRTFETYKQLREELRAIKLEHLKQLPPEFGPNDIYDLMVKRGWVTAYSTITIKLPEATEAAKVPRPGA